MSIVVRLAESPADRQASWRIRERVFIGEQGIAAEIERDDLDDVATHLVAWQEGEAIGTARVIGLDAARSAAPLDESRIAKIGRMAVLPEKRRLGVGRRLLDAALDLARRRGIECAELSAQEQVIDFYVQAGFQTEGDGYLEAGIRHRRMKRQL